MSKVSKINILFLLVCFCFPTVGFGAKFFKWTDEDGNIHYSDKAPVKQDSEAIHVNASKPSESAKPPAKFTFDEEQQPSPEELAAQKEQEKELREYCQNLQANIRLLEIPGRIQTVDEEGKRTMLDKEGRANKLEKSRQQYSERCKS